MTVLGHVHTINWVGFGWMGEHGRLERRRITCQMQVVVDNQGLDAGRCRVVVPSWSRLCRRGRG